MDKDDNNIPVISADEKSTTPISYQESGLDYSGLPLPVHKLTSVGHEQFHTVAKYLKDTAQLQSVDTLLLTMLAKNVEMMIEVGEKMIHLGDIVQETSSGYLQVSANLTAYEKASKAIVTLSGKLGLSPADREKMFNGGLNDTRSEGSVIDDLQMLLEVSAEDAEVQEAEEVKGEE